MTRLSWVIGGGALLSVCLMLVAALRGQQSPDAPLQRPRRVTANAAAIPKTVTLRAKGDLQKALDAAQPGDTIILEAGASFNGPFTLPRKSGDAFITVQSSALGSLPDGVRVSPASAASMPKILSPGEGRPALRTAAGAHHYRLVGIEFAPASPSAQIYDLVELGDASSAQNSLDKVPHHLVIDRCYVHAFAAQPLKRGIALNSSDTDLLNSYIADFKVAGQDSQAVGGWNGPGPFKIINNYLEAAGENLMFGGAAPSIPGLVPSDIEVKRNHFRKPLSWKVGDPSFAGTVWTVKNLFELKNARRVVVEGNLFENNWEQAQAGYAIVLTVRGDSGPQATVEDVDFRHNVVRHSSSAFNLLGKDDLQPSGQGRGVRIVNNLIDDVSQQRWGGEGRLMMICAMPDVLVDHNTVLHTGTVVTAYGGPSRGFVMTNNITAHNAYGIIGDNHGPGLSTINAYLPGAVIERNVIAGADPQQYPRKNFFPPSLSAAGFVNPASGNYRLSPSSPFKGKGADGHDPGCDFDALSEALASASRIIVEG